MARSHSAAAGTARTLPYWWWAGGRSQLGEGERGIRNHLASTSCAPGEDAGACKPPAQDPCHAQRPVVSGQGTLLLSSSLALANTTLGLDDIVKRSEQATQHLAHQHGRHHSSITDLLPIHVVANGTRREICYSRPNPCQPPLPDPCSPEAEAWSRVSATGARLPLRLARIWAGASCGPEPLLDCMVRKTRERSGEVRPLSPGAPAPKRGQDS